jgi:hypothetical protein
VSLPDTFRIDETGEGVVLVIVADFVVLGTASGVVERIAGELLPSRSTTDGKRVKCWAVPAFVVIGTLTRSGAG